MNIPSESAVVGQATFAARFGALLEPKAPAADKADLAGGGQVREADRIWRHSRTMMRWIHSRVLVHGMRMAVLLAPPTQS